MKTYINPQLTILTLTNEDILTASPLTAQESGEDAGVVFDVNRFFK